MKKLNMLLLAFAMFLSSAIFAQDKSSYTNEPGYFDFGDLSYLESGPKVSEIFLQESLIQSIAEMSYDKDDPELKTLLNNLKLIKVNSYGITEKNSKNIDDKIKSCDKELLANNWERMVSSRDVKSSLGIYLKNAGKGNISGLVILAKRKNGEATFVNIVGKIDLMSLGKIGRQFNIPSLDKVKESVTDKDDEKDKK